MGCLDRVFGIFVYFFCFYCGGEVGGDWMVCGSLKEHSDGERWGLSMSLCLYVFMFLYLYVMMV